MITAAQRVIFDDADRNFDIGLRRKRIDTKTPYLHPVKI